MRRVERALTAAPHRPMLDSDRLALYLELSVTIVRAMVEKFPDRRVELFGRESDVHRLLDRARQPGLTVVTSPPHMGKTWTLTEVARRVTEEGRHLVGYYEAKTGEQSHLLYAVSDLYTSWLADSAMREQALSLWKRYRKELVPKAADLVGGLFEKLGKPLGLDTVGTLVRDAFLTLSAAQKDLAVGGLNLAVLPYDQALSLTQLVAEISGRRIVFILDAWEKSPTMRQEAKTIESFLNRRSDWPPTHVFAAVRSPDPLSADPEESSKIAEQLCRMSSAALSLRLDPMHLNSTGEADRLVAHVQAHVDAAKEVSPEEILRLVGGHPGVVKFWLDSAAAGEMRSREDMQAKAQLAHSLRYVDLENRLDGLTGHHLSLAARLAVSAQFSESSWDRLGKAFLRDDELAVLDDLCVGAVLEDRPYPTYGHDTRHSAAADWFVAHRRTVARRSVEEVVGALSKQITGISSTDFPIYEAISGLESVSRRMGIARTAATAFDACKAALEIDDPATRNDFVSDCHELVRWQPCATPLVMEALIKRANWRATRRDFQGAYDDYAAAIELPDAPKLFVAWALRARGTAKGEEGDKAGAISGFTAAIELQGAPAAQVAKALIHRASTRGELGDLDGEIADYSEAIDVPGAPADQVASALFSRGIAHYRRGDIDRAMVDCGAAINLPGADLGDVVWALLVRATAKASHGDSEGAIADCSSVIELPGASADRICEALNIRGRVRGELGDDDGAISDFTSAIQLPGAPADQVAKSLVSRGIATSRVGNLDDCLSDCTAAIELPGAPAEQVAKALAYRGLSKERRGDSDGARADYTSAIDLPGAPAEHVASSLCLRGTLKSARGDGDGAMGDFTAVIDLPDAPAVYAADALVSRAILRSERDEIDGAIVDLTRAIDLPDLPVDGVARALLGRGRMKSSQGDIDGAVSDYSLVVSLPGAPGNRVGWALISRSFKKAQRDDIDGAIADYTEAIEWPGLPADQIAYALVNRGVLKGKHRNLSDAIGDYSAVVDLPGVSPNQLAKALLNRGTSKGELGDTESAVVDYDAVVSLPGAPVTEVGWALVNRGAAKSKLGDRDSAIADFTAAIDLPGAPADVVQDAESERSKLTPSRSARDPMQKRGG